MKNDLGRFGGYLLVIIIAVVVATFLWLFFRGSQNPVNEEKTNIPENEKIENETNSETVVSGSELIRVSYPQPNEQVGGTINVTGIAKGTWYFEGEFPIELVDLKGNRLASAPALARDEWMKEGFVPFSASLRYPVSDVRQAKLVLKRNNPSDLREQDASIEIPIVLEPEKSSVNIFFSSQHLDPYVSICDKSFPVARSGSESMAITREAVEELLKGPNGMEKSLGYGTAIPKGVMIQNLDASTRIARIDLSKELLELDVDVACRRLLIKTQIEETIKNSSGAEQVIITVDGKEFSYEIPER